tara:strand:- start:7884 stop:9032 length:1149 start_codon:yes stop_codon:yes gene_type:complete
MKIALPDTNGRMSSYTLTGTPVKGVRLDADASRTVFSAAHVVADPFTGNDPSGKATIDWDATMGFRRHLVDHGLGIAEAMDTAQRGMGLDWTGALELITRTKSEFPDALVFNGAGTDHLDPADAKTLDDVRGAYLHQIESIQKIGGRIILMASRALARLADSPDDYVRMYGELLDGCEQPVILHWLGEMFDPELAGYWGSDDFDNCMDTTLAIISQNISKVDGIKISLLDKDKEIRMRRLLPTGVRMYTGDDFNYPELIEGDEQGFSHALLGIFDPLAPAAAYAISELGKGNAKAFRQTLDPSVPLARQIFRAPTRFYKTGVVFMAWLNGFQDHFIMLNGAQASRPLPDFVEIFKMADCCGLLRDPDLAVSRMKRLLSIYGA